MAHIRSAQGQSAQEGHERGRTSIQVRPLRTVSSPNRLRACNPARRQMLHEAEKKGQVAFMHALFVEREKIAAAISLQVEIGVFDALGDALETHWHADVVSGEHDLEILKGYVGVDRHGPCFPSRARLA